jgi:photosystem II stability/assembly factor-like uncharacterized protein
LLTRKNVATQIFLALFAVVFAEILTAATWQATNITIGPVKSFARDSSGRLYAGAGVGIYLSNNHGESWQVFEDSTKYSDCFSIEFNVATGHLFIAVESGIYRSNDVGLTWEYLGDEVVGTYSMAVAPGGVIWVAGAPGTFISTDNGNSWTLVHATLGQFGDGLAVTTAGSILESTLLDGLFRTTDNGQNWSFVGGQFNSPNQTTALTAGRSAGLVFSADFFTDQFANDTLCIYRSTNDGVTWTKVAKRARDLCTVLYADGKGNIFAGRNEVFRSPDNGSTWTQYSDGLPFETQVISFIEAADGTLLCGSENGIHRIDADSGAVIDPPPPCCRNFTGNVNGDVNDATNIVDVTTLVAYLFQGGSISACQGENDVDKSGSINVVDLTRLVNFLFHSQALPNCP